MGRQNSKAKQQELFYLGCHKVERYEWKIYL